VFARATYIKTFFLRRIKMLCNMKKPNLLVIVMSCVLLMGSIFPGRLLAETVTEEWVARYDGPNEVAWDTAQDIALDDSGNVYVTGFSTGIGTERDYATIKYDTKGNELWVARYDGPGDSGDYAMAIAVDSSGNVYVTGYSTGSGTDFDYATIKYDTKGKELWVARYDGPANSKDDTPLAIAVDSSGNVYVTGESVGIGGEGDYATIKYDTNGNQLWVRRYDGPGNDRDWGYAIAVDDSDNVYVTGQSVGIGGEGDYATIKYDTDGNQLWLARYNGPGNDRDIGADMAVDSSGNVYVTGRSYGIGTDSDYATVKYDTDGNELWVERYNGPANLHDYAVAIAVDSSGNIYVTGVSGHILHGGYEQDADYATIKYDTNGNEVWVARYNGPGNAYDMGYAIAVDDSDNVYVTGQSMGSGTYTDYATIKYDTTNGDQLWVRRYNGPANAGELAAAIAVDSSGSVYVTGYSRGTYPDVTDYATVKYSKLAYAVELLLGLTQDVIELNLQNGIENSLDAKLNSVFQALEDISTNNDGAAINTLEAFINAVEAQSGNQIPDEAEALALSTAAEEIIAELNAM
jgi:hypothetical protein